MADHPAPNPAIAIPNLLYRYAMLFDDGDFAGAAALFDHGHVVTGAHRIAGADNIVTMWRGWVRLYDGRPRTRHITTNPIIDLADDGLSARCQSQWTVVQAAEGYPLQVVATGRYDDRLAVINGAWQFTERHYVGTDLVGDTSAHLNRHLAEG
jgi:3-phenylpropionate/cinnamic acid dioxygenase small subunit